MSNPTSIRNLNAAQILPPGFLLLKYILFEEPSSANFNLKIYKIMDFLKQQEEPQNYIQIKEATRIDLSIEFELLEIIKTKTDSIEFKDGLLSYKVFILLFLFKPSCDIKSKADLLKLCEDHFRGGQGIIF
jgi:hypothetical protein